MAINRKLIFSLFFNGHMSKNEGNVDSIFLKLILYSTCEIESSQKDQVISPI